MTLQELTKLVDQCEEKYEDYVYVKMYGDGSGGLYSEDEGGVQLTTWDDVKEMEIKIKEWLKTS